MIFTFLRTMISGNGFMLALSLGAMAMFWTYDSSRVTYGKILSEEKTRNANDVADKLGASAALASGTPKSRGVRNPHYRE